MRVIGVHRDLKRIQRLKRRQRPARHHVIHQVHHVRHLSLHASRQPERRHARHQTRKRHHRRQRRPRQRSLLLLLSLQTTLLRLFSLLLFARRGLRFRLRRARRRPDASRADARRASSQRQASHRRRSSARRRSRVQRGAEHEGFRSFVFFVRSRSFVRSFERAARLRVPSERCPHVVPRRRPTGVDWIGLDSFASLRRARLRGSPSTWSAASPTRRATTARARRARARAKDGIRIRNERRIKCKIRFQWI